MLTAELGSSTCLRPLILQIDPRRFVQLKNWLRQFAAVHRLQYVHSRCAL